MPTSPGGTPTSPVIADNAIIGNRLWGCCAHGAEINLGPTDDAVWLNGESSVAGSVGTDGDVGVTLQSAFYMQWRP